MRHPSPNLRAVSMCSESPQQLSDPHIKYFIYQLLRGLKYVRRPLPSHCRYPCYDPSPSLTRTLLPLCRPILRTCCTATLSPR
jgi:hypothetical protein